MFEYKKRLPFLESAFYFVIYLVKCLQNVIQTLIAKSYDSK